MDMELSEFVPIISQFTSDAVSNTLALVGFEIGPPTHV